jgi:hypothetical protein
MCDVNRRREAGSMCCRVVCPHPRHANRWPPYLRLQSATSFALAQEPIVTEYRNVFLFSSRELPVPFFFWPFSVLVWLWYACERRIRLYEHCRRRAARGVPVDIPRRRSLASTVTFFLKKILETVAVELYQAKRICPTHDANLVSSRTNSLPVYLVCRHWT